MSETQNIDERLLQQLGKRAQLQGISVNDLLANLLELETTTQQSPYAYLDAAPSAITIVDVSQPHQPAIYVNRAFERETGYSAAEVIGRNLNFLQGDDREQPGRALMREAIQQRQSCTVVLRNYRKDGSMFWNEIRLAPLTDTQGQITRYIGIQNDVTERIRAQQALRKSEEKYRLIAENTSDGILIIDGATTQVMYASPAYERQWDVCAEELDKETIYRLIHPEDRDHIFATIDSAIEQQISSLTYTYRTKNGNGKSHWKEDHTHFVYDPNGNYLQAYVISRDITARVEADNALRESEARYKLLTEMISDYAVTTRVEPDGTSVFEWVAGAFETMTGYAPEEAVNWPVAKLRHPDDRDRVQADIARTIQGEMTTSEYRIQHKNGDYRWIRVQRKPVWDDDQQRVVRFHSAVTDITERKKAEDILREVMASVQDIVYAISIPNLDVIYMSDAVEKITGYPVSEFYKRKQLWLEYIHSDDLPMIQGGEHVVMASGHGEWTYRLVRPDGDIRWVYNRAWLVRDEQGTPVRITGIITDITEQRRTHELLTLQNTALESTANAIVITDRDANIEWVNPAFTRLTGYTFEEARGRNPNELVRSGRHDQRFYEAMWDTILSGQVWFGKLINRRKDSTLYTEEQTITPVYDNNGQISHFIAIKQDITERERSQQFTLDYESLKARFQKEQEQNVLIQQTIAALSHDLRTPLSVIATAKDILGRYFDQLSEERRQEKLDSIGRQLQYAIELLDDTVKVAKSNLNHRAFRPAPVNLAALCRVSVEEVNTVHGESHDLCFENMAEIDTVFVDEILVSRILVNLLSNAIKYSPVGGQIRLELDRSSEWIILRVIDQGMGISQDDLPHIFEPFFRADIVTGIGGTGLGLSIVKDCVDRHQGHIHVESTPGQGSTFTVELPVQVDSSDQ